MSKRLTINNNGVPAYDIVINNSFDTLVTELSKLNINGRKICIVSDSTVAPLYISQVRDIISGIGSFVTEYVFEAGEKSKNLDIVRDLYEQLILNHFERKDILIALGGGVVGDLTGFTAATYLRGIDFIQLPTTVLAQVDSSIGGKTGVDFSSYKNMVGAFHMPRLVYISTTTLNSLDKRTFNSGFGEIIKHGFIKDKAYLDLLNNRFDDIENRCGDILEEVIYKSCQIKGAVVEKDPTEQGERALLNFGHTLGHAIEKLSDFQLYHGECVVLGMICALAISLKRGCISQSDYDAAIALFTRYGYMLTINGLTADDVIKISKNDKKMDQGHVKFILLNSVGNAYIDRTVTDEEMKESLQMVLR